ncbi:hypothetical protein PSEUBRA_005519 [Kalmanozyma brasiliensis GHG001]|uniref:uncharacterized protein n=1 Tax=Kalmanozyma brasiliensis (strain GHG001) TaxID=1365824 RepID=UPI002867C7C4|nr:uncharacterized protein PSEUBRA_005519 [Kalmanozyma brasiliensis GHG001]KAF6767527.1 hypothetical protein PSEUBRA_005519 [Kalmanozyma brasiliensis GHG001]
MVELSFLEHMIVGRYPQPSWARCFINALAHNKVFLHDASRRHIPFIMLQAIGDFARSNERTLEGLRAYVDRANQDMDAFPGITIEIVLVLPTDKYCRVAFLAFRPRYNVPLPEDGEDERAEKCLARFEAEVFV